MENSSLTLDLLSSSIVVRRESFATRNPESQFKNSDDFQIRT
jgi:hypothetical protein